ncbi:universal stress protein [Patulibacter americanus]|uniref:universal stress protein n=1 Tax=Patulibacter americanus TaxID=588672 RepID=UPI0003B54E34|nr:universal stress protein [Patulibacter americanus]
MPEPTVRPAQPRERIERPVVLVPFDRSADAEAAIREAARLVPHAAMTVLAVWRPSGERPADPERGAVASRTDEEEQELALARATVGARHAAAAGVAATPRAAAATDAVAITILTVADELDADLIVLGGHGREGERYARLGPTVRGVLEGTGRPVLVVAGPDVPHHDDPAAPGRHGATASAAWVPRTPEDERDGTA